MNIKIKLYKISYLLATFPLLVKAQFVKEEREQPSEFSLEGLEAFKTVVDVVNVLLALLLVASLIGFVVSGVKFVIAGGGEATLDSARKTAIASLVGFVLSLVGYVVISVIEHYFT